MIRRPPRSTLSSSSAASDVYKRQLGYGARPSWSASPATAPSTTGGPPPHSRNSHWRARCQETGTPGSGGGRWKRAERHLANVLPRHHGPDLGSSHDQDEWASAVRRAGDPQRP